MIDRNKTELTHNITRLSVIWLDEHGFKPVETEVPIADKWIADVAGVNVPTRTELINLKLIKRKPYYPYLHPYTNEEIIEHQKAIDAWKIAYNAIPSQLTALIEVKASRADFKKDKKWNRSWVTNLCYLAIPSGMIDPINYPKGWGIILFDEQGKNILKVIPGQLAIVSTEHQLNIVLSLAMRQYNKIHYETMRNLQKEIRIQETDKKTIARIQKAISFVEKILNGKPIEEARAECCITVPLPHYLIERMVELEKRHKTK